MLSQDDDSEEVRVNALHYVMALMTRRFEQLLITQEERQAKQFAELFGDADVDASKRTEDVAEQTVSLCEEFELPERESLTYTEAGDSEASVPTAVSDVMSITRQRQRGERLAEKGDDGERARFADIDAAHVATQETVAREQSTEATFDGDRHVSVTHSVHVKLGEALSWQLESYKMTVTGRHTPDMRSVNSVQRDNQGVDVAGLVQKIVYRLWEQVGVG